MTKNRLLILNITLIVLLGSIIIIEKYPSRVYNKLKSQEISEPSYFNNWRYKQELGLYEYYQKKGQIVMLGNSITYRADWNELLNRGDYK